MSRWLVCATLLALPLAAHAGNFQDELEGKWLGAWVVTKSESYSNCNDFYADNRINGDLAKGSASGRFGTGELAKLDKVDLKRSRLDLFLTFAEPLLVAYQDGPFTLYREATCKVQLEVELPREAVKAKDDAQVERRLTQVLERYATEAKARASNSWNGRQREAYPADYASTVARHTIWKAEQTNAAVQAQIDRAVEETSRLTDRMSGDAAYMGGFAQGVQAAKIVRLDACSTLMSLDLVEVRRQAAEAKAREQGVQAAVVSGFQDGKALIYGLSMIRNLRGCFVPVPEFEELMARH